MTGSQLGESRLGESMLGVSESYQGSQKMSTASFGSGSFVTMAENDTESVIHQQIFATIGFVEVIYELRMLPLVLNLIMIVVLKIVIAGNN